MAKGGVIGVGVLLRLLVEEARVRLPVFAYAARRAGTARAEASAAGA